MFFVTYKTTLKTLLRSFLFWMLILIVLVLIMGKAMTVHYSKSIIDDNYQVVDIITDKDPEFQLTYKHYIQTTLNGTWVGVMLYAMPLFAVFSTMLLLQRDYGDSFYEIESSSGIRKLSYWVGRLITLFTVNILMGLISAFAYVNYYYFSRGGCDQLIITDYLADSTLRIFRLFTFAMLPGILFYIAITFAIGCVFKSGFMGAVGGIMTVLIDYVSKTVMRTRFSEIYHDYLSPKPLKLYNYWCFYETEWFDEKITHNPFTQSQMLWSVGITLGIGLLLFAVSFFCVKKRRL